MREMIHELLKSTKNHTNLDLTENQWAVATQVRLVINLYLRYFTASRSLLLLKISIYF